MSGDAAPDGHLILLAVGAGAAAVVGLGAFYKAPALAFMSVAVAAVLAGVALMAAG